MSKKKKDWIKILSIAAGFIMLPVYIYRSGYNAGESKQYVTLANNISEFNIKEIEYKSQIMKLEYKIDSLKLEIKYGKR